MVDLFQQLHSHVLDPDRFPVAIAALLLVSCAGMVAGPLGGFAGPMFWRVTDLLFGWAGARMDRTDRSAPDLVFRGFLLTAVALAIAFLVARLVQQLAAAYPYWRLVEMLALCVAMSSGAFWHATVRLYKGLSQDELVKGAFYAVSTTTRTDLTQSDEFTITRIGMMMAVKGLDKAVVAPVLWYLIAGIPGAFLYAALAALSWRFGKDGFSKGFGQSAMALEKLLGFVPNLLAGLLIALATFITPTAGIARSTIGLVARAGDFPYAQGGLPVTALAWALNISLGGPSKDLDGSAIKRNWTGPDSATAQIGAKHLHRGLYLVVITHLLFLASLLGAMVVSGRL